MINETAHFATNDSRNIDEIHSSYLADHGHREPLLGSQQPAQKNLTKSIKPLITKYCLECHSADDPSGGVELDQLSDKLSQDEDAEAWHAALDMINSCLLYTSPSPRDGLLSRMPSSA